MTNIINSFPGYEYRLNRDTMKYENYFRGLDMGKGGYVYGRPGIYTNVALLDIQSMHPNSAVNMNYFGDYTSKFKEILDARIAIKNGDYETAKKMFGGQIAKYLDDTSTADQLASALKIVINSVYGMSSAPFDNPFRDPRNVNNIIALRGALFMKTLQDEIADKGYIVAAIRTDSIKIPNADLSIINYCMDFASKYGYKFEHEATYDRMCLIDNAQYVAAYLDAQKCIDLYGYCPKDNKKDIAKHGHPWTATGTEFQRPFIFKTLFSGEPLEFDDYCVTNNVQKGDIYLDMNESGYPDVSKEEKELEKRIYNSSHSDKPQKLSPDFAEITDESLISTIANGHNYCFIGHTGRFYPVSPGNNGGVLVQKRGGKYSSVTGAKGYRWLEAEFVKEMGLQSCLDPRYHKSKIDEAIAAINKFGDFESFIDVSKPYNWKPEHNDPPGHEGADDELPFDLVPCGDNKYNTCMECPNCVGDICRRGYSLASFIEIGGDA